MNIIYPVIRSSMPPMDEYVHEIAPIWDTRGLTNRGEKVRLFEKEAGYKLGADNAISCVNGHQALELAFRALDLEGEVITTPYTFVSTTAAIVRCGLTPVFCDIREDDFTIDADKIESLITEKTCAIAAVHVYGNICDDEKISDIARRHGLKVIYDAAHAFGVRTRGIGAGALGDMSMFSLHATKVMHSIEGGLLCYKDASLGDKLWQLQNFGLIDPDHVELLGANAKMNEFQGAMGLCNLRHIDEYISARKAVYERYAQRLAGIDGVRINTYPNDTEPNYAYFPVIIDPEKAGTDRDVLSEYLAEKGIGTRKYFAPLVSDFARYACYRGDTPTAARIAAQVLTLPMYDALTMSDADYICDAVIEAVPGARK